MIGRSREVVAQRRDGSIFPVDLAVSEVAHLGFFVGMHHDLTNRKQLQKQVLEISADEQRRIGQELHDGTQQELTGLSLIAGALLDELHTAAEERTPERSVWQFDNASYEHLCDTTMKLSQRLSEAHLHVQQLARGIMPVQIDAEGLRAALGELAASTNGLKGITCRCECAGPVKVGNNTTATHLYRIAQEAVNNAVRHSQASEILILLDDRDGHFVLEVCDNGTGFDAPATTRTAQTGEAPGMGLRIMEYRASLIGGRLQIERQATGGTAVKCEVLRGGGVIGDE